MWSANSEVLVTDLGDELVLLHPAQSQMFSLNAAGRLIWGWLPAPAEELSTRLAASYELDPAAAQQDVQAVLDDLLARELVQCQGDV